MTWLEITKNNEQRGCKVELKSVQEFVGHRQKTLLFGTKPVRNPPGYKLVVRSSERCTGTVVNFTVRGASSTATTPRVNVKFS